MPAKVLLVEDDNNLREIYQARLMAEGYTIVTARDGEEALGVAKAEMPDLIISDVMMPRVSGFEMLDILRNTEGLKDVKVIMLTALGQADDKTRANSLGADRYLVKSQVTLEDIVKTSHELLEGPTAAATTPAPAAPAAAAPTANPTAVAVAPEPAAVTPAPDPQAAPVAPPVVQAPSDNPAVVPVPEPPVMQATVPTPAPTPSAPTTAEEQASIGAQIQQFVNGSSPATTASVQDDAVLADAVRDLATTDPAAPVPTPAPTPETAPVPTPAPATDTPSDSVTIANKKTIQPLSSEAPKAPIHELLAREEAAGMHSDQVMPPAPATTFSPSAPVTPTAPPTGPVVSMPEAPAQAMPSPAPAVAPSPSDPNSISL